MLPPLSPAFRMRRLFGLTLRDLRRLARGHIHGDWQGHLYGRLAVMPEAARALDRAQLLAALSVGDELIRLREIATQLEIDIEPALAALAAGDLAIATARLAALDAALAVRAADGPVPQPLLRARAGILVLSEALRRHADYFAAEAVA
jgi:hypothetical protein